MKLSSGTIQTVDHDSAGHDITYDHPNGGAVRFEWLPGEGLVIHVIRPGAVPLPPIDADQLARTLRSHYELDRLR
jgi:hypothetical protein